MKTKLLTPEDELIKARINDKRRYRFPMSKRQSEKRKELLKN